MNKHLKNFLLLFIFTTVGCQFFSKRTSRSLAEDGSRRVTFFDSRKCSLQQCALKIYDLDQDVQIFQNDLDHLIQQSEDAKKLKPKSRDMDMLIQFHLGDSSLVKGSRLALSILKSTSNLSSAADQINEVFAAINNNFRPPLDTNFQLFYLPVEFFNRIRYNSVRGKGEWAKIPEDPQSSTFWQPRDLKSPEDFFTGFDRTKRNELSKVLCDYDKAKSGYGVHPGFHIQCGEQKFKLKLGPEVHSAAFNARLYHGLGYNVPTIDFVEEPTIQYSRKLLTEFNSRRIEHFRLQLSDKTLFTHSNDRYYSPYDFLKAVELADGSRVSVSEFKKLLFKDSSLEKPEMTENNYDVAFERTIKKLIFIPASYILKTADEEVGPWRYDQLNHQNRLELKGMQLLAAWVGNFDMRMDNSRLVQEDSSEKMKHMLSDVGSGLGESSFLLTKGSTRIDKMPWTVTSLYRDGGDAQSAERLEITGLMNIETNKAFRNMTFADGQWMLKKLCAVTPVHLKAALISSGLTAAEGRLALEKLISRRTEMLNHFDLAMELPACNIKPNKSLNYDENQDGPFTIILKDGTSTSARNGLWLIKSGRLIPR